MYWTAGGTNIGSYDDATGFGGEVSIPGARFLGKIVVGADGFLYAADSDPNSGGRSNQIWRIDPVTFAAAALTTPTRNSLPWGLPPAQTAIYGSQNHGSGWTGPHFRIRSE
jgi:hypothetical protein